MNENILKAYAESGGSLEKKLKELLLIIRKHLNMEIAFIAEFVDDRRVFRFVNAISDHPPVKVGNSDPLEMTYCKKIADSELPNIICDTGANDITRALSVTEKLSIGSYMGVPLILSNGDIFGTLCCFKKETSKSLNKRDLGFLKAISEIASNLLENLVEDEQKSQEIAQRIQSVLSPEKIDIHYQPILDLETNTVTGFESLSRFVSEPYRPPNIWFSEASQVGMGEALELIAINKALQGLNAFPSQYISLNTSPEYILNGAVLSTLSKSGVDTSRIVLEITEHSPIIDYKEFIPALKSLRELGIQLAIDDAGAGYSSFQHILELEADIIKLDITLTKNIHLEPRKLLLAKALCGFAKAINCTIIAEGIEASAELDVLRDLGIDKVQGYLIGKPMPLHEAKSYDVRQSSSFSI